ncbi:blue copper protein [Phtheirospermum japonicum]|uniref:Blue copper protein n=1 Tax=Phtheirospermum japonicum TaxID=374723 RepID=A0A830BRU3_9LAMI|nr:blue copper protein [Phtheirospermum japonicum]
MLVAALVAPSLATNYVVGDDVGWRLGVNYSAWAEGKDFRVGDTLVFMYYPGAHNVMMVNGTDFRKCASSDVSAVPFTSGSDVIHLTTPGRKGYICTIGDHCSEGMKLVITVSSAADGPLPAPFPGSTSSADQVSPFKSCVWMIAFMAAFKLIINRTSYALMA